MGWCPFNPTNNWVGLGSIRVGGFGWANRFWLILPPLIIWCIWRSIYIFLFYTLYICICWILFYRCLNSLLVSLINKLDFQHWVELCTYKYKFRYFYVGLDIFIPTDINNVELNWKIALASIIITLEVILYYYYFVDNFDSYKWKGEFKF